MTSLEGAKLAFLIFLLCIASIIMTLMIESRVSYDDCRPITIEGAQFLDCSRIPAP